MILVVTDVRPAKPCGHCHSCGAPVGEQTLLCPFCEEDAAAHRQHGVCFHCYAELGPAYPGCYCDHCGSPVRATLPT